MIKIQDLRFATVEQFYDSGFEVDDVLQLSPGRFDFTSTQVELDGVLLHWNRIGARFRSREIYRGSGVLFGLVLQSPGTFRSVGYELGYGHAVVWHPQQELEYIVPSGLTSLIVHVDSALADLLGWNLTGTLWQRVSASHLNKLEQTCRLATRAVRQRLADAGNESEHGIRLNQDSLGWRDRILADLDTALEPWMKPSPQVNRRKTSARHFELVKEVESFFARHHLEEPLILDVVAQELGVPRRTLFHAFRKSVGVGPHAYLTLVKLHRLRDRLLKESPASSRVSQLAHESGFNHLGRLSAIYKQHFGESPSETLKRA